MSLNRQQVLDIYRDALARINGQSGEPSIKDFEASVAEFRKIAAFSPGAKAKLAVLTALGAGTAQDKDLANALFLEAAMSGLPPIARELGAIVAMSGLDDGLAASLLIRALQGGDWIAGFLILRQSTRGQFYLNREQLIDIASSLSNEVPFKNELIREMRSFPEGLNVTDKTTFNQATCHQALDQICKSASVTKFDLRQENPRISTSPNVLTPFECDYMIAISCVLMQPSKVVSSKEGEGIKAGFRTSDGAVLLPHLLDFPSLRITEKLSAVAGIKPRQGEFLSLLRYTPGQEYLPHHDFLEEDKHDYSMVKKCGQRCATLLTYLNEGYEGGETAFPKLDVKFKGNAGDSLYFENTDRKGKPIPDSLHAGLPVQSGEKWLATLWIREKPFWPWAQGD